MNRIEMNEFCKELLLSPENVGGESGAWAQCSGNEAAAAAFREIPKRATPQQYISNKDITSYYIILYYIVLYGILL